MSQLLLSAAFMLGRFLGYVMIIGDTPLLILGLGCNSCFLSTLCTLGFGDNVFRLFLLLSSKVEFLNQILAVL